jgi:hypothetical protein
MTPKQADGLIKSGKPVTVFNIVYKESLTITITGRNRWDIYTSDGGVMDRGDLEILEPGETELNDYRRWLRLAEDLIRHQQRSGHPWSCRRSDIVNLAKWLENGSVSGDLGSWQFAAETLLKNAKLNDLYRLHLEMLTG